MEARQERIADMVKSLLPCIRQCERKKRIANLTIFISLISCIVIWGYGLREFNRPIDINEYTAIRNVISLSIYETHETEQQITQRLLTHFNIEQLQDLKGRQLTQALKFIAQQQKH